MSLRPYVRLSLVAIALAAPSPHASASPEAPGQVFYLLKPVTTSYTPVSEVSRQRLLAAGASNIEDYGPFVVVTAPISTRSTDLENAAGLSGRPYPGAFDLDLGGTVIDYRFSDRNRSENRPELFVEDYPKGGRGLYVVKLVAPARREWLERLEVLGIRLLQYIHQDAYVVEAPAGLTELRAAVAYPVVHVMPYHPFYKMAPDLRDSADEVAGGHVVVLIDAKQDNAPAVALLRKLDSGFTYAPLAAGEASATLVTNREGCMALAALPSVIRIEPFRDAAPSDERANQVAAGRVDAQNLPTNQGQYRAWLAGLCGGPPNGCLSPSNLALETVEVMDTGLAKNPSHQDLNNTSNATRLRWEVVEFGQGGGDPDDVSYHGTFVTGLLAGDPLQTGGTGLRDGSGTGFYYDMGIAPGVSFGIRKIFQLTNSFPSGLNNPSEVARIVSDAYTRGARFHNDSWNYSDTSYSLNSREFDRLVRDGNGTFSSPSRGFPIIVSAGNAVGTDYRVRAPGTAKNVITVGASGLPRTGLAGNCNTAISIRDLPSNSRQGIASDLNRFKPDLVAPGRTVTSARADGNSQWDCGIDSANAFPPPANPYMAGHGTSFSTPQVCGAAVLLTLRHLYDGFTRPSPALLKATLIGSSFSMQGGWNYVLGGSLNWEPAGQGWGRLGINRAIEESTPRRLLDEDKAITPITRFVSSGGYKNLTFSVADPSKEVAVVLAYTDAPAAGGATIARVNQLNLYVLQGGAVYCDGQYTGQYTTRSSGCYLPDMYNNVKRTRIAPNSFSGTFTVQIVAGNVAQNAVPGLDGIAPNYGPNQDWALYVYNAY